MLGMIRSFIASAVKVIDLSKSFYLLLLFVGFAYGYEECLFAFVVVFSRTVLVEHAHLVGQFV